MQRHGGTDGLVGSGVGELFNVVQKVGSEMRLERRVWALNKEFGLHPVGSGESVEDLKKTVSVSTN